MGFFDKLKEGLKKTRANFTDGMEQIFNNYEKVTEDFYDELEETMIMGDIGVKTTEDLLDHLREEVRAERIRYAADCRQELIMGIRDRMKQPKDAYDFEKGPAVILVIGVNGVGKTTSIGKLAANYKSQGKRVLIASADTFRAAANEQLTVWARRAGVDIIGGKEGSDPASVVFDAVQAAKARKIDILLCDTAGRLHNKKNLMNECGHRTECRLPGQGVCIRDQSDRHCPDQDGRYGQRRYCDCGPVRGRCSRQIHRRGRKDRGSAAL